MLSTFKAQGLEQIGKTRVYFDSYGETELGQPQPISVETGDFYLGKIALFDNFDGQIHVTQDFDRVVSVNTDGETRESAKIVVVVGVHYDKKIGHIVYTINSVKGSARNDRFYNQGATSSAGRR